MRNNLGGCFVQGENWIVQRHHPDLTVGIAVGAGEGDVLAVIEGDVDVKASIGAKVEREEISDSSDVGRFLRSFSFHPLGRMISSVLPLSDLEWAVWIELAGQLGKVYLELKQYEKAILYLRAGASRKPDEK